ncbi:MAG: acyl-CoA dehydrogenase family protein [Acidimicrobiales bacterium]
MDFSLNDEQQAVAEAARGVMEGLSTPDRVDAVERSTDRMDRRLWSALADADLLGTAVPEDLGGNGHGMVELALVLEAQGRVVAPVPLWSTLVLGTLPVAEFGSDRLRRELLPRVTSGEAVLTAALADVAGDLLLGRPGRSRVTAKQEGDCLVLDGTATAVPWAHVASHVLVPATTDDGAVVAVLDPRAAGITVERAETTNREIHPHLHLEGVRVPTEDLLAGGDPAEGSRVVTWMLERARTGLAAIQVGVVESALSQTVDYLNGREQFGRPLSTFQATLLRVADTAIDTEAIRVTLLQAAWCLDNGRRSALPVGVCAWFASEAGQRAVHATQHLHGGIGADTSYPIHRYFLWGKQIELLLGTSSALLADLGHRVAGEVRAGRMGPS